MVALPESFEDLVVACSAGIHDVLVVDAAARIRFADPVAV
jgi:hypothetical protein